MDVILKYNQMKQTRCTYLAVARGQALNAAGCLIVRAAEVIGTRRGKQDAENGLLLRVLAWGMLL